MSNHIELYNLKEELTYHYCAVLLPFRLFFNLKDDDKSPKDINFSKHEKIPEYVLEILESFKEGFDIYLKQYRLDNPLEVGIYFEKGAKFIDVMIADIPVQKGLVAAELVDNEEYFENNTPMHGEAIKILLDKNLIKNSATPIHELFHVFQYNYCSFNNMWFMEGLARWSQNITHDRKNIDEKLPSSYDELETLTQRAHDVEYFWRKLIKLSLMDEKVFIKKLLQNCAEEALKLEKKYFHKKRYKKNSWSKAEKKSAINNSYIFDAILNTVGESTKERELKLFLEILKNSCASNIDRFNTPQIQRFLKALMECEGAVVHESDAILHCDDYNVETKTVEIELLKCLDMDEYELESFNILHHIKGDLVISSQNIEALNSFNYLKSVNILYIENMANLNVINGFNALESINGLKISGNKNLVAIKGFNSLFEKSHSIEKFIKIIHNKKLQSISFLSGLKSVKSSFYLHSNALVNLKGLESLEGVGASFSLSSNNLKDISALLKLKSVNGMLGLAYNNLSTLHGLENLKKIKTVKWNGENRTLLINANPNLNDISAIENIINDEDYYMIIMIDSYLNYLKKPSIESNFHKNILEFYEKKSNIYIPTYKFASKEGHNYENFGKTTHSTKLTHLFDFEMKSDILVISFSGFNGWLGGVFNSRYPFLIGKMTTNKIFIMDKSNSWYHEGVEDLTANIDETIDLIKNIIAKENYSKIFCIGASMGGYMALLAGRLVNATNILAFSPQTFIDKQTREKYNDKRWSFEANNINEKFKNSKYLNLQKLYKEPLDSSVNVEIHYSKKIKLDEIHANYLQNSQVNIIGYDDSDHYIAVYLHKKGMLEDIVLSNLGIKNEDKKIKILFGDKWQKAVGKCEWLSAHHINFKDIDAVINYSKENEIKLLFANNYATQVYINQNEKKLKDAGLKFIVNNKKALKNFVNKQIFYDLMLQNNLEQYVPKYYNINDNDIIFPCIIKTATGGAGRGIFLAHDKKEIGDVDENTIISEYLSCNVEYATSIFYKDGKILKDITFSKTSSKDVYVLQQEKRENIVTKREKTPFLDLFKEVIEIMSGKEGYCACSINFKIIDNKPKIFEINPRIGYTLAGFCDDFKEMIDAYIDELKSN